MVQRLVLGFRHSGWRIGLGSVVGRLVAGFVAALPVAANPDCHARQAFSPRKLVERLVSGAGQVPSDVRSVEISRPPLPRQSTPSDYLQVVNKRILKPGRNYFDNSGAIKPPGRAD